MRFKDVLGQENAKKRIIEMVDRNEIPHALLISGESGIPKLALARAMAQYIHCQNRQNGDSCGQCPSCLQHQSFNHADTFFSFPFINKGKIDVIRLFDEEIKKQTIAKPTNVKTN